MTDNVNEPETSVAVLAYAGCMGTEILALADVLLIANHMAKAIEPGRHAAFRVQVVSVAGGSVALAGGLSLATRRLRGTPGLLVVPGLEVSRFGQWDDKLPPLAAELALIRRQARRGGALASVCIGSFLLAEAGLLDGRRATTAWPFAAEFAQRYPAVQLEAGGVLQEDGAFTTAGAVSSAFDLAVHLVERHMSPRVARATARFALVGAARATQLPYVDASLVPTDRPPFSAQVHKLLLAGLDRAYDLKALSAALNVSSRTLLRRYAAETGQSPLAWLQAARIEKAKRLLEKSSLGLGQIVEAVGYQDVATFSRLFLRQVRETPAQYRRRHGPAGRAGAQGARRRSPT
ncbi:MAG: helix-turn-helix domain-containing protein [Ramlibacter sp.]|nr:helix-turn-helix domain-containing protein [Ramlibacter sp.]